MIPPETLRHLMEQAAISSVSEKLLQESQIINKIILEFDLDGIRYYLVQGELQANCHNFLSPREKAIATLVAQGFSNKSIAKKLEISPWTVATYLRRMFTKLKVNSRAAMIAKLLEAGNSRDGFERVI